MPDLLIQDNIILNTQSRAGIQVVTGESGQEVENGHKAINLNGGKTFITGNIIFYGISQMNLGQRLSVIWRIARIILSAKPASNINSGTKLTF